MKSAQNFWLQSVLKPDLCSMFLNGFGETMDPLDREEIFSYLPPIKGKKVLDLACGIGRYTTEFAKRGALSVTAVDINPTFLAENQEKNSAFSNIEFITSNALDLKVGKGEFDLIFISWLFLYLSDKQVKSLIKKLNFSLKEGGHLFFRESCAPTRKEARKGYFAIYRRMIDYPLFFPPPLWKICSEGNLKFYEELYADPFKCFWLIQKTAKP